jgi:Ca2+-binding RTX toxin-like protein
MEHRHATMTGTLCSIIVLLISVSLGIVFISSSWPLPNWAEAAGSSRPIVTDYLAEDVFPIDFGNTTYTFTVEYSDVGGIDVSSIDADDVNVRDPSNTPLTVISGVETPTTGMDGSPRTATYTVTPPGGSWDSEDIGTYAIELVGGQVLNIFGAPVAGADPLTSFSVLGLPGVVLVGDVLRIVGTDEDDQVHVNQSGLDLKVHADFAADSPLIFSFDDINQLRMYLGAGNDLVSLSSHVQLPTLVHGGVGNDVILGGGGPSVLLGGAGDDTLNGSKINDILIGGDGADRANGIRGDDILIGGTTDYDTNDDALFALLEEWNAGEDYNTRVSNILTGGGSLDGIMFEKDTTIFDDGAQDRLTGSTDFDWFFFSLSEDEITDKKDNEEGN